MKDFKIIILKLKSFKKEIAFLGVVMLINVILMTPTPLFTMYIIDNLIPDKNFIGLLVVSISLVFILVLNNYLSYFLSVGFLKLNTKIVASIQIDLLKAFQNMPLSKLKSMQTGYIMARIKNDPQNLSGFFADTLLNIIKDSLVLIVGTIIIFWLHWKLALISIIILPCFIISLKYFSTKIRDYSLKFFEKEALYDKQVQESISLIGLFRTFCAEELNVKRFSFSLNETINGYVAKSKLEHLSRFFTSIIGGLSPIIIICYGVYEVMTGNLLLGEMIAFNSFFAYVLGPTSRLINVNIQIQNSLAATQRINQIFDYEQETSSPNSLNQDTVIEGSIDFVDVSFNYSENEIFKKFNLIINKGETIGIIGKTGTGKSTLSKLILAFENPKAGTLNIDNKPIAEHNITNLRNSISIVEQEPLLFTDSIINNIRLGNPTCSDEEVYSAAKIANVHDFIIKLDKGYNTLITESSFNISIGEKQRIAIARAIVRNPKILILDEFSSSLDISTEKKILNELIPFIKSRTTIIIAHRLSTVEIADKIYEIKDLKLEIKNRDEIFTSKS